MRVTLCGKRTKRSESAKNATDTNKSNNKDTPSAKKLKSGHEFIGGKHKKSDSENRIVGAMKRIKLKV